MDRVNALIAFVHAVDQGSFVAASQHLGISASAVGKSISRLEARIGVRLIARTTRSLTLTLEGTRFLERCRRIIAEIDAAEQEFSLASATPAGRLRVSFPMFGEPFVSVLAKFQRQYPSIDLDVLFTDRKVDLVEEGFDIVLRTGVIEDSGLISRRLGTFRMILAASPDYLLTHGTPGKPEDLQHHRTIALRFASSGRLQPWQLLVDGKMGQLEPPNPTICSSIEARLEYAVCGVGIVYLPDFCVRHHLADGRLVSVLDTQATFRNTAHLLWNSNRHMAPRVRAFIDFAADHLSLGQ